jgi:hypothetical protein
MKSTFGQYSERRYDDGLPLEFDIECTTSIQDKMRELDIKGDVIIIHQTTIVNVKTQEDWDKLAVALAEINIRPLAPATFRPFVPTPEQIRQANLHMNLRND